jgi:hypothetical protein
MQWQTYEKARLAARVRQVSHDLTDIANAALDFKLYQISSDLFEPAIKLYALERQLLELPSITPEPAPGEELSGAQEQLPF